tara:strand:- start:5012 stop:5668 length:657 start_codon:yes stop_codon:yes gene_type:complete
MDIKNFPKGNSPKGYILSKWNKQSQSRISEIKNPEMMKWYEKFESDFATRYDIEIKTGSKLSSSEINFKKRIPGKVSILKVQPLKTYSIDFDVVKISRNKILISYVSGNIPVKEQYFMDEKYGVIENSAMGNFVYKLEIENSSIIKISKYYFKKETRKRGRPKKNTNSKEAEDLAKAKLISLEINKSPRKRRAPEYLELDMGADRNWSSHNKKKKVTK